MAKYRITGPDGANYEITAPDGASESDVLNFVKKQTSDGEKTGALSAATQGVGQGLSFGFADELEGAARGAYDAFTSDQSFSDAYASRVANARRRLEKAREDQPLAFYTGEIGSALAVPGGLARAGVRGALAKAAEKGVGARSVAAAKEGAVYGSAYGLGSGEGVEGKLTNAVTGAGVGGVLGAAAPAIVDTASAVARGLTNPLRGYAQPQAVAAEKMGEAFARDAGASGTPNDVARAMLKVQQSGRVAAASDPQMMLADIGGDNVRRLSRQAFNMPNDRAERFRTVLDRRQVTAPRRIEDALRSTLADGNEFFDVTGNLVQSRAKDATPAFTKGYAHPLSAEAIRDFQDFAASRGYVQRIFEKTTESVHGMTGKTVDQMAPWEMLHRAKMEINREIGRLKRGTPDSKANWDIRDLTQINRELGALIGKHNKPLAHALSKFADESTMIRAVEDGLDDFKTIQPEELAKKIGRMPKAEADLYRIGAARSLVQDIRRGSAWNDRTKSLFASPEMNLKLKAVFPQAGERSRFMRVLDNERRKARLRGKVQGGSQTDQNLVNADEAGAPMKAILTAAQATTGRIQPLLDMLSRAGNRFSGLTPASANAMLDIAMTPAGQGLHPLVLKGAQRAASLPGQRARTAEGLLAGFSSGLPGSWD